jgi:hypothetical protein
VVLDGANLMWAYGIALARRFGCKAYPASAGLTLALDYEARALKALIRLERGQRCLCRVSCVRFAVAC